MLTFKELGKYGRLGNQMFQIASTIGLATSHGYAYGFPEWKNYDHLNRFGSAEDVDIQKYFKNALPPIEQRNYSDYFIHWGYHNFKALPDNLNLLGHMQSEKYFSHCKDLIRHYFEFSDECEPMPKESIAIHIRRGDYDDSYHPTMKEKYYKQSLDLLPNVPKFVFSDDIKEAKKIIGNDATYIEGNHYMKDLQMISKCRHFVLSNSTFCWWGWWLADHGKCIAPKKWFGDVAQLSSKDIYTDEMIII